MSREASYTATLKLSADSPEELRRCDVDRVATAAAGLGHAPEFLTWLLTKELRPETRAEVCSWAQDELGVELDCSACLTEARGGTSCTQHGGV